MKRSLHTLWLLVAAVLLTACAALNLEKPRSPEDNLRYGQATLTAVYDGIRTNNDARTITLDQAKAAKAKADQAKTILASVDATLSKGGTFDVSTVQAQLSLALNILQPLLAEMQAKAPKKAAAVSAVPVLAIGAVATIEVVNGIVSLLITMLGFFDKNGVVSRIIGRQIAEGRKEWTPEERLEVTDALRDAEEAAQASIDARAAAGG